MSDSYGCWGCTHFREERLTDNFEWIGYCELDPRLHKRHFIAIDNIKCENYLPGFCMTIYDFIKRRPSGVTEKDIEKIYGKIDNLNELLEALVKQDYIASVNQDGITYYFS